MLTRPIDSQWQEVPQNICGSRNYKICQNWNENDWFSYSAGFILVDRLWLETTLHSNWCIYLALCCVQLKFAFNDLMTRWKHDSPINIECEYNNDVMGQSCRHQLYLLAYKYFHQPINWVVLAWPRTAWLDGTRVKKFCWKYIKYEILLRYQISWV